MMAAELENVLVLVLEDDYLLADDTRRALARAGARVLGPFAKATDAIMWVDKVKPDCALVDLNLGEGPNVAPARQLVARGVPIIFFTGYERDLLPDDLSDVTIVQKPANEKKVVDAVRAICGRAAS